MKIRNGLSVLKVSSQSSSEDTASFDAVNIATAVLFCVTSTALTMEPPHTHTHIQLPTVYHKISSSPALEQNSNNLVGICAQGEITNKESLLGTLSGLSMVFHRLL